MTANEFIINLEQNQSMLKGFAVKLTKDLLKAEELVQDTTFKAFKASARFKEGTNFKAWISVIMRNTFINNYRKNSRKSNLMTPIEECTEVLTISSTTDTGESTMLLKELQALVAQLPEIQRVPFQMHYEGYSYQEISDVVEMPLGTIKSRIFAARKALKSKIAKAYNTQEVAY